MSRNLHETFSTIAYLRSLFEGDAWFAPASKGLWGGVKGIMQSALDDYDNCVPVLRVITGLYQIHHTKELTNHTLQVLVSEWKSEDSWEANEDGQRCIVDIENLVKEHPKASEIEELYRMWKASSVPSVWDDHLEGTGPRHARSSDIQSRYQKKSLPVPYQQRS